MEWTFLGEDIRTIINFSVSFLKIGVFKYLIKNLIVILGLRMS